MLRSKRSVLCNKIQDPSSNCLEMTKQGLHFPKLLESATSTTLQLTLIFKTFLHTPNSSATIVIVDGFCLSENSEGRQRFLENCNTALRCLHYNMYAILINYYFLWGCNNFTQSAVYFPKKVVSI